MGKKTVPHLGRSPGIDRKHGDGTLWNRLWRFLSSREDDWRLCSLPETLRLSVPRAADVIGYVSTDWLSAKSSKGFGRWSCRGLPSTWYLLMFPDNAGFWCSSYSKARVTCGDTKWLCLQIGYPRSTGLSLFSQLKWPFGGYHVFRLTGKCSVSVGEEGRWELAESRTTCLIFSKREGTNSACMLSRWAKCSALPTFSAGWRKPGIGALFWTCFWSNLLSGNNRRCLICPSFFLPYFIWNIFGFRDGYPLFLTNGQDWSGNHWAWVRTRCPSKSRFQLVNIMVLNVHPTIEWVTGQG